MQRITVVGTMLAAAIFSWPAHANPGCVRVNNESYGIVIVNNCDEAVIIRYRDSCRDFFGTASVGGGSRQSTGLRVECWEPKRWCWQRHWNSGACRLQ